VGEKVWDQSHPPRPANEWGSLHLPCVVYSIASDAKTGPKALFVVEPNGSQRPLNDNERVFQDRRKTRRKLAYHFKRIERMERVEA
jgi:hypothetical protein